MSKIHTSDWKIDKMPKFDLFDSIEYYLPLCQSIDAYPSIAFLYSQLKFLKKEYHELPKGFVHGDISDTNILICEKACCILDFDQAKVAPYLYEVARSLIFFAFDKTGAFNYERAKRIMNTYSTEMSIKEHKEKIIIQLLHLALIQMLLCTFYYVEVAKEVSPTIFSRPRENQHYNFTMKKLRNLCQFYE